MRRLLCKALKNLDIINMQNLVLKIKFKKIVDTYLFRKCSQLSEYVIHFSITIIVVSVA